MDGMEDSQRIRCRCGRFARNPRPVLAQHGPEVFDGYLHGEPYIADVVNDCRACGDGTPTGRGWWLSWDAWYEG